MINTWWSFFRGRGPYLLSAQRYLLGASVGPGVEESFRVAVLGAAIIWQRGGRRRQPVHQGDWVDDPGIDSLSGANFDNQFWQDMFQKATSLRKRI